MSYIVPEVTYLVSTANASTAALSGSASFTGTSEDVSKYSTVNVSLIADQNCKIQLQHSSNGTNWDHVDTFYTKSATSFAKTVNLRAKYFRTVITNLSASAQTYLRLQTIYKTYESSDRVTTLTESQQSVSNSSTTALSGGATFTGLIDSTSHPDIEVSAYADVAGTLYFDFTVDGTNWITEPTTGYAVAAGETIFKHASKGPRSFRVRYTNGGAGQAAFRLYTYTGTFPSVSPTTLDETILEDDPAQLVKAVIGGVGEHLAVVTHAGALYTTPPPDGKTSFGETLVGELQPIEQQAFLYDLNPYIVKSLTNSGSATVTNQMATASTGAGANQTSSITSKRFMKYESGQGMRFRMTGLFSTGAANSTQLVGFGTESNGFFFGYNGTSFGILHRKNGAREIRTLTITTASSHSESITITLNGDTASVPVTNSGVITTTANEIASFDFSDVGDGWEVRVYGAKVVFLSTTAGSKAGSYSLSAATSAVGTFAQTLAGATVTDTWTPQASWNGDDIFDGNGPTGLTLDPTKGNVYQIDFQYLGFGNIRFYIEDQNDGEFQYVHNIQYPNTYTTPSLSNPNMPFLLYAGNAANTSDIVTKCASYGAFIDGTRKLNGNLKTINHSATVASSGSTPVLSLRVMETYNSLFNTTVLKILNIAAALEHTKPGTLLIYRNATLTGASFSALDANSSIYKDTSATAFTSGDLLDSIPLAKSGNNNGDYTYDLDLYRLEPGDILTVVLNYSSGTNADVFVSVNGLEIF